MARGLEPKICKACWGDPVGEEVGFDEGNWTPVLDKTGRVFLHWVPGKKVTVCGTTMKATCGNVRSA